MGSAMRAEKISPLSMAVKRKQSGEPRLTLLAADDCSWPAPVGPLLDCAGLVECNWCSLPNIDLSKLHQA